MTIPEIGHTLCLVQKFGFFKKPTPVAAVPPVPALGQA
jgi:hypothetical protein